MGTGTRRKKKNITATKGTVFEMGRYKKITGSKRSSRPVASDGLKGGGDHN